MQNSHYLTNNSYWLAVWKAIAKFAVFSFSATKEGCCIINLAAKQEQVYCAISCQEGSILEKPPHTNSNHTAKQKQNSVISKNANYKVLINIYIFHSEFVF